MEKLATVGRSRLDGVTAWLRLAVTLISGLSVLTSSILGPQLAVLWGGAIVYSALVIVLRPHRFCPARIWWAVTGMIDWTLISVAIVLTGGLSSDLYVLYFVLAFGASVRFGLREAVFCGLTTSLSYLFLMVMFSPHDSAVVQVVALRMGYLMAMAVGCGLLASEADRETRADLSYEAEQIAVRDVAGVLSRELTNPLLAASGLLDIVLDPATGPLSAPQRALLCGLNGNIEHASSLVRNVVAAERIERSQHGFSPCLGDLNRIVQHVVDSFAHPAQIRGVGLVLNLMPALPVVSFDARWLEHALRNILSNAVQFTPHKGAIRVSTSTSAGYLSIEVWNSGPAISPRLARGLFGKFVREPSSRGIGLGLYVVKQIADLHGGEVRACNAADGVTVLLTLPCPAQQPSLIPLTDDASWTLRRDPALAS